MFGPKPRLGFSADDLDLSPEAHRRRTVMSLARRSAFYFRLAMAICLVPMLVAVFVQALLSDRSNRWMTFWIMVVILGSIAAALELFIVRKQMRQAARSVGAD